MSDNGNDDDTPARPYRITRNPEAMWYVKQLANYELALTEAIKDIHKLANDAADDENPPGPEKSAALSRAAIDIGSASYELAFGINPSIDRRRRKRAG